MWILRSVLNFKANRVVEDYFRTLFVSEKGKKCCPNSQKWKQTTVVRECSKTISSAGIQEEMPSPQSGRNFRRFWVGEQLFGIILYRERLKKYENSPKQLKHSILRRSVHDFACSHVYCPCKDPNTLGSSLDQYFVSPVQNCMLCVPSYLVSRIVKLYLNGFRPTQANQPCPKSVMSAWFGLSYALGDSTSLFYSMCILYTCNCASVFVKLVYWGAVLATAQLCA